MYMPEREWKTVISGGICTNSCTVDLRGVMKCHVSSYQIANGGVMRTGKQNTLYDVTVNGNLFASDSWIHKLQVPTGVVSMTGSANASRVFVGGHLDCAGQSVLTELEIVSGGKVTMTGNTLARDISVERGGEYSLYGTASANQLVISSGATVIAYGQTELNNVHVCSGGRLECYDDTKSYDVYIEEGATFICHDGAEVVYTDDSPQKPITFGTSAACCNSDDGLVHIYRAKVTVFEEKGTIEVQMPVSMDKVFLGGKVIGISWKGTEDDKR